MTLKQAGGETGCHTGPLFDARADLATNPDLWQHGLLDPSALARFSDQNGVKLFNAESIRGLWKLGLLRCDLLLSTKRCRRMGLIQVHTRPDGLRVYVDCRYPKTRRGGWRGALAKKVPDFDTIAIYFHPFRYYVLYHLHRTIRFNIHPMQYFWKSSPPYGLLDYNMSHLNRWTSSEGFVERVCRWNKISELAAIVEPKTYPIVFQSRRWGGIGTFDDAERLRERYFNRARRVLEDYGLEDIESLRRDLCMDVETLDENKVLHVILRLMNATSRQNLKGAIGGSMAMLSMAEMLRRAEELVFSRDLPEEDQLGFGQWMEGARRLLFGSERILDAPNTVRVQALRQHGLDHGVRARCYVEGDTEFGALTGILGIQDGIDFVNLRGQVSERAGRGVAFRDSLRRDMEQNIFSFVVIDGDREDYVRAVRTAAERGEMFGSFLISDPDFELFNFTLNELCEILWEIAKKNGVKEGNMTHFVEAVKSARSGSEMLEFAQRAVPALEQVKKGKEWGEKLMSYAVENPQMKSSRSEGQELRPILEFVQLLSRCRSVNYVSTRDECKVDPERGRIVRKDSDR